MNGFNEGLLGTAAGIPIYASAIIITLGVLLCALLTLALHVSRGRGIAPVLSLSVFGFAFGVLFSRLLHWYFNAETYASFLTAMTDYSVGSFCLPGALLGIWLGAWLTKKLGLARSVGELLDDAAPGTALLIAVIRLSALFNTTCRSRIPVTTTSLQFVPLAMPEADLAGNTRWRLSTFFIELVLMLIVMGVVLYFRQERGARRMKKGCPRTGNVARLFMLLYAAVEIVLDSTRNDRPLMHFRLLSDLNQYSAFISLAQVFPAVMALASREFRVDPFIQDVLRGLHADNARTDGYGILHRSCWHSGICNNQKIQCQCQCNTNQDTFDPAPDLTMYVFHFFLYGAVRSSYTMFPFIIYCNSYLYAESSLPQFNMNNKPHAADTESTLHYISAVNAELRRRAAFLFLKDITEILQLFKPACFCNLPDLQVCCFKQQPGIYDPDLIEKLDRSLSVFLTEFSGKIADTCAIHRSKYCQINRLLKMLRDIHVYLLQL